MLSGQRAGTDFIRGSGGALFGLLGLLVLAACGGPDTPPGGPVVELRARSAQARGEALGRRLGPRAAALLPAWRDAYYRATVGVAAGAATGGAAAELRSLLDLCVDQCRHRAPERLLQELDGLAAGSGIAADEVLGFEVMRDVFRLRGLGARLPGAVAATRVTDGLEARAWWGGPDAAVLARDLVVVVHPGRTPVALVTWPGGLGALAGLRGDGLGFVSAELDLSNEGRRGFAGGQPFTAVARQALEEASDLHDLAGRMRGTMGHVVLCFDARAGDAVGSIEAAVSMSEVPLFLGEHPFLALGPFENVPGPRANALLEETHAAGTSLEARWRRAARAAEAADGTPAPVEVRLRWVAGVPSLTVHRAGGTITWRGAPAR